MAKKEEIEALELMTFVENENLNDETLLFMENSQEEDRLKSDENFFKSLGFKDSKKWFSYNLAYSSKLENYDEQESGREVIKTSLSLSPHSYFFLGTTMMFDVNDYRSKAYQPDFVYSFGYRDWHPNTWSLTYSNYSNNKFKPDEGEERFHLDQGGLSLGYKNKIDDISLSGSLSYSLSDYSKKLSLNASTKVAKKVLVSAQLKHYFDYPQQQLTLSGKSFLYKKFFVSGSAYLYSHPDEQVPFEPDYAYSFGWKDNRPFYPSVQYSNYYTPTRWPSRTKEGSLFKDGSVSVSFKLKF